jgi:O-antigen/teichoic acid export membrane protein
VPSKGTSVPIFVEVILRVNVRSLISNASVAFLAQGVSMVLSIVTSLLVPKVLGVEQYGYWQLFIFYTSYVGFFHLGLNDGMYLVHGGTTRDRMDKRPINSQFWFGMAFQTVFAAVIVAVALAGGFGPERTFVIVWTAIFLLLTNSASYLGYLFQAMNETKLFSYSTIIERAVFLVPLVALIAGRVTTFEPYVYAYAVSTTCKLVFCLWHARDFLSSGLEALPVAARQAVASIRIGIKLMLANIASQLTLGVARFVIDAVWGIATFGELSFSLSMVNFFLAFVTQASMVLFPALRQSEEGEVARFYRNARDIMGLFFPAIYVLYFPMVWLLSMWLPQYANSFVFFAFLLPICVFDSKMNITCTTYFKVAREEATLLRINVATTLVSAAFTLLGAYVLGSVYVVIGGVVVAIIGRSVYSERRITSELGVPANRIAIGELAVTVAFMLLVVLAPTPVAVTGYLLAYGGFLWCFRAQVRELAGKVKRVGRG